MIYPKQRRTIPKHYTTMQNGPAVQRQNISKPQTNQAQGQCNLSHILAGGQQWNSFGLGILLLLVLLCTFAKYSEATDTDIALDAKATLNHRIDSLNLLVYTFLLTLTVLTIWLFKHHRVSWLHETGLAVIYGLIVGAIIRYAGAATTLVHMQVEPQGIPTYDRKLPPDTLWFRFPVNQTNSTKTPEGIKTYAYVFRGQVYDVDENEIDLKATFDPEVFFNIILPPIIFHAGYSLKKKYFFRNLGAILTFAILGTTLSAFLIGGFMYGCVKLMPKYLSSSFTFLDTLYFGALISPTDPLTILAIFHDLHVDVNLYALVLGESVLNDAVAIVLSGAIQNYGEHYSSTGEFESYAFLRSLGDFFSIFFLSLMIGAAMGCFTALLTKFTRVRDFPLLESALFVLMSYSTFLLAEATELTGVVAVLFCGICQAHYTYNNLSEGSRARTKQLFDLLNFLAENFIFSYIGVSMFTFPKHHFDAGFIVTAFICAAIGRAVNVYPLSWLLNIKRKPKISSNFQHMLFFAGLRGAMSFALAIRNTVSDARQTMLTATSLIVIFTVIIQGGAANFLLNWLKIPIGVDDETEQLNNYQVHSVYNSMDGSHPAPDAESGGSAGRGKNRLASGTESNLDTPIDGNMSQGSAATNANERRRNSYEKAILARIWGSFDTKYMKPLLTHSRPTLLETLPVWCNPVARLLTTTQQLTQDAGDLRRADSDSDICIDNVGSTMGGDSAARRNSINRYQSLNNCLNKRKRLKVFALGTDAAPHEPNITRIVNTCGALFCSDDEESNIDPPSDKGLFLLIMIYIPCIILGVLLIAIFLDPLKRYGEGRKGSHATEMSVKDLILATFHQMKRPNQQFLIPITIFIGMEQAYAAAEFTEAFVACALGIDQIGYVMIVWGLTDSIACFVFGFIMKYIGRALIIMLGATVNIGLIGFQLHWRPNPKHKFVFFMLAGILGIGDAVWVTQINGLYGLLFRRNKEAAFSTYRFFEAMGFVIAFIISKPLCVKEKLLILYVVLTVGLIGYLTVEVLYQNKVNTIRNVTFGSTNQIESHKNTHIHKYNPL